MRIGPLLGPLVLLRHGTSQANLQGRVAGWQDVDLSSEGVDDSLRAARALISAGITVDVAHVSVLLRARRTAEIIAEEIGLPREAIRETWHLNERHAGAFQGMTRDEMIQNHGREPVRAWKNDFGVRPLPMQESDSRHPRHDPRYSEVPRHLLPSGEASSDVLERVIPYWKSEVEGDLRMGKGVLVVTHEHVLRVLIGYLRNDGTSTLGGGPTPGRIPWLIWLNAEDGRLVSTEELSGVASRPEE